MHVLVHEQGSAQVGMHIDEPSRKVHRSTCSEIVQYFSYKNDTNKMNYACLFQRDPVFLTGQSVALGENISDKKLHHAVHVHNDCVCLLEWMLEPDTLSIYLFVPYPDTKSYVFAAFSCRAMGGLLASISSQQENDFLTAHMALGYDFEFSCYI